MPGAAPSKRHVSFAPHQIAQCFVGREAELASLSWALERAGRGDGRVVLLAGEPGVGKTRLAEQFAEQAAQGSSEVHWGRCWEWGGAPALWPWIQLVRSLCERADEAGWPPDALQTLKEAHSRLAANEADASHGPAVQFTVLDAVCEAIARVSREARLLLFIDDLHAADPASIHLLRFLARDTRRARVLVVATCRDAETQCSDEVTGLLGAVERDSTRLQVAGLRPEAVHSLIAQLGDERLPDDVVTRLIEATGGNPLYLCGMLQAAAAEGTLSEIATEGQALPADLRGAIERRLSTIEPEDRRVLSVLAALGRDAALPLIVHVSGIPEARVEQALNHARAESLARETGGEVRRYRLAHSLMADVVYRQLPAEQRAQLHGSIGEYLETAGAAESDVQAGELARHFLAAGPTRRRRGAAHARAAARQAFGVSAYDQAAELYERILEVLALDSDGPGNEVSELLLDLAEARRLAGRPQAARAALRRAAQLDTTLHCFAEASLGMARTSEFATEDAEAIGLLERALSRTEAENDPQLDNLRVRLLSALATELWMSQHARTRRLGLSEQARTLAERLGDPRARAGALMAQLQADWHPDVLAERLEWTDELAQIGKSLDDPILHFEALRWRLNALWEKGDIRAANVTLDAYDALATRMKWPQARLNAAVRRAVQAEIAGDLNALAATLEPMREWGPRAADPQASLHITTVRVTIAWLRGDWATMRTLESQMESMSIYLRMLPAAETILVSFHLAIGNHDVARARYEHFAATAFSNLPQGFGTVSAYCRLAAACHVFDDRPRAATLYELLQPYADQLAVAGPLTCAGSVQRALGLLCLLQGQLARGIEHFELALQAHQRMGARTWEATSFADLAAALDLRGDAALDDGRRAQQLRGQALTLAQSLGFGSLVQELQGETESPQPTERADDASDDADTAQLQQQGDVWRVVFDGRALSIKDSRGLHHLARLLARPGQELHVLELSADDPTLAVALDSDAGEVLDDQAQQAYRGRVENLRDDLAEAERWNDTARAEQLREELEFIASQLAEGLGLGGRQRRSGSTAERARAAVTRAIRRSLSRLAEAHPTLGQHLERTIRTGVYCCYDPDPAARVLWSL